MLLFLPARLRHPLRYSVGVVSVFGNCQDFPPRARGRGKKGSLGADAFSEQLVARALRVTAIGAPVIHVSRGSLESKREATWEAGICNYDAKVFTLLGPS